MPPSLRRTVSSPMVRRPSPYPSSLSVSSSGGPALRSQGNGHRRSSGSETMSRRVLADIEWWIVAEGQRDLDVERGAEEPRQDQDHDLGQVLTTATVTASSNGGGGAVDSGISWLDYFESSPVLYTSQLVPQTPPRRGHSLESSTSSLESTPEAAEGPIEGMRRNMQYLDLDGQGSPRPPLVRRSCSETLSPMRDCSFLDYLSETGPNHYADFAVSPLSSHSPAIFN
ncbi:hypothetical protein C8J56DRAFT_1055982 [Mycena floridula]|nr:hypothetical protein C8J56DRAFT_1055982 [Mycena floridula]